MIINRYYFSVFFFAFGLTIDLSLADQPNLIVDSPSQMVCKVIQDPKTKVIFYLESDRHHLSAISPKGTLLWQIDTWSDAWADYSNETIKSKEERKSAALINFIELYKPEKWFAINETGWSGLHLGNKEDYLSVSLNDRIFGLILKSTGKFIFVMQN